MNRTIREMTLRMKQNGNGRRRLFHWLSGPMTKGAPVRWNTRKRAGHTSKGMGPAIVIRPILAPVTPSGVSHGVSLETGIV